MEIKYIKPARVQCEEFGREVQERVVEGDPWGRTGAKWVCRAVRAETRDANPSEASGHQVGEETGCSRKFITLSVTKSIL